MKLAPSVVVAAIVIVFCASVAMAQRAGRPNTRNEERDNTHWEGLGILVGPSLTTLGGENGEGDSKMGWNAGAYAAYRFHKHARAQAEFLYTNKGGLVHDPVFDGGDATLSLAYVQPTLLFEGVIPANERLEAQVYGGLTLAMLVSASLEDRAAADVSDFFSDTDIGVQFGVSVELIVGKQGRCHADLRFDWGMKSIDASGQSPQADVRSRALMLLLGYSIL